MIIEFIKYKQTFYVWAPFVGDSKRTDRIVKENSHCVSYLHQVTYIFLHLLSYQTIDKTLVKAHTVVIY